LLPFSFALYVSDNFQEIHDCAEENLVNIIINARATVFPAFRAYHFRRGLLKVQTYEMEKILVPDLPESGLNEIQVSLIED
jgi:hypothetical protein